jgi:hypothetical protein
MNKHALQYTGEEVDLLLDTVNNLPANLSEQTYLPQIIYHAQTPTLVDVGSSNYSTTYGLVIPFTPELDAIYNLKLLIKNINTYVTLESNYSMSNKYFVSSNITSSGINQWGENTYVASEKSYPTVLDITFTVMNCSTDYSRYYYTAYNANSNYYFHGYFCTSSVWNSLKLNFNTSTMPYVRDVILTKLS